MNKKLFSELRHYVLLIFLFTLGRLNAQVHAEFGHVNEYVFNTKEALNLVLVNNHAKAFQVYIQAKITDASGELIADLKSAEVLLNTGVNIITPSNTAISDINYHNSDIAEIEQRTGTYPSGNYRVCVWLNCVSGDCSGAGPNAAGMEQAKCIPVHVENPTPLILATPEDNSEIEERRPLFTWIPPAPVAGADGLNYTMILVEILEGQSKADALNMNRPLIEAEGIGNPALVFPSDLPELEKGKSYAWQVEAFVGKTPIAKSEQWKFKIKKKEEKKVNKVFLTMRSDILVHAYEVKSSDTIALIFEQNYNIQENSGWNISMKNEFTGKYIDISKLQVNKVFIGLHAIEFIPFENISILYNSHYVIELRNLKGEKYYVRIIFKN